MIRPKILVVGVSIKSKGGISSVVHGHLSSRLVEEFEICHLVTYEDGTSLEKLFCALKAYLRFLCVMKTFKPDIVHLHVASRSSFYRKLPIIVLAKLAGVRIIYHHHGGEFMEFYNDESGIIGRAIIRRVLRTVDSIVVLSNQWLDNFRKIDPNLPLLVVSNFVPSVGDVTHQDSEKPSLVFFGRLCPQKGLSVLLDAVAILKIRYDFQVLICGEGDLELWSDEVKRLDISDLVTFTGWVSGEVKRKVLTEADIFVLPSYNEGLPMSVLEAMSFSLPIVATPVGGVPEAVVDGVNGFWVNPGDVDDLQQKISYLLSDYSLRQCMGQNSCQRFREMFDTEVGVAKLSDLYNGLVAHE